MPRHNIAIGLSLRNSYSREVFDGFTSYAAREHQWELLPFTDQDVLQPRLIKTYAIDAILLNEPDPARIARARALRVPAVNVSSSGTGEPLPTVVTDNRAVGELVADYFIGKGYRNFGFCGTRSRTSATQRLEGYRRTLDRLGLDPDCCWHPSRHQRDHYEPEVERALLRWLRALPKPVGILAGTDRIASQLAGLSSRHALRMPEEISIVGVGQDEIIQKLARLQITSVVLGSRHIGFEAGVLIARLLRGARAPASPVLIPPVRIVEGRSTNVGAANDPTIHQATDFMLANLGRSFGIEEVATSVGRSRRSLERHFSKTIGISPHNHLKRLRLERVRQMIATSDESLDTIGRSVGLTDGSHLSVFFRSATGETPSSYRHRSTPPIKNAPQY